MRHHRDQTRRVFNARCTIWGYPQAGSDFVRSTLPLPFVPSRTTASSVARPPVRSSPRLGQLTGCWLPEFVGAAIDYALLVGRTPRSCEYRTVNVALRGVKRFGDTWW